MCIVYNLFLMNYIFLKIRKQLSGLRFCFDKLKANILSKKIMNEKDPVIRKIGAALFFTINSKINNRELELIKLIERQRVELSIYI